MERIMEVNNIESVPQKPVEPVEEKKQPPVEEIQPEEQIREDDTGDNVDLLV